MLPRVRGIAACVWALVACGGGPGAPAGAAHPSAAAATWHVATTGSDGASGTETAPWQTLQHAADRVKPGDIMIVHAGTYAGFRVGAAGRPTAPIAFVADGAVRIDGALTVDRDAIHIEGASWVRVEGFTVTHAARAGISALDCDHRKLPGGCSQDPIMISGRGDHRRGQRLSASRRLANRAPPALAFRTLPRRSDRLP